MRRYVLAPVLVATAALLVGLGLLSFVKAVEEDLTALLYGAGLLGLAVMAGAVAVRLWSGRLPQPPLPAAYQRLGAAALSLAAAAGSLAALALAWWILAGAIDGEGGLHVTTVYSDRERVGLAAVGAIYAAGSVGLLVTGGLLAAFATTGRPPRPAPLAWSAVAVGVLVASGFFASLVLAGALRGDYP